MRLCNYPTCISASITPKGNFINRNSVEKPKRKDLDFDLRGFPRLLQRCHPPLDISLYAARANTIASRANDMAVSGIPSKKDPATAPYIAATVAMSQITFMFSIASFS